jgi:hypothetical protein
MVTHEPLGPVDHFLGVQIMETLEIHLQRQLTRDKATLGELSVNGIHFCFTLEDAVRIDDPTTEIDEGAKVYGETAIPEGTYDLDITFSPKFQKDMILVKDVKGFTGIRIHSGNDAEDTLGCILVGSTVDSSTRIHGGSTTLPLLFALIHTAIARTQRVILTIANAAHPTAPQRQPNAAEQA